MGYHTFEKRYPKEVREQKEGDNCPQYRREHLDKLLMDIETGMAWANDRD